MGDKHGSQDSDSDGSFESLDANLSELDEYFEFNPSTVPIEKNEVKLHRRVWGSIPEEILWNILMRLPVAAHCRFCYECPKWKALLSAPSSAGRHSEPVESDRICAVLFYTNSPESKFFSYAENRWYRAPYKPRASRLGPGEVELRWVLKAADGGLLCYQSNKVSRRWSGVDERGYLHTESIEVPRSWVLVSNPITGSFQILPPCSPFPYSDPEVVNFSVDQKTNSLRVVMMGTGAPPIIFDSRRGDWKTCESNPVYIYIRASGFVWRNTIYKESGEIGESGKYAAFDTESGTWSMMELSLPCSKAREYQIISSKDQVMLVQVCTKAKDPVRIWMLRDFENALQLSEWEKVAVEVPDSVRPLLRGISGVCWAHQREFICFGTKVTQHWVKYTFRTRSWLVMPPGGNSIRLPTFDEDEEEFLWSHWEPYFNIPVSLKSVDFDASDYPEIASFRMVRRKSRNRGDVSKGSGSSDNLEESDHFSGSEPDDVV